VNYFQRGPLLAFACVLIWRVLLLVFTAQPIPAHDAFGYDGGVVNYLHGGGYCNPSLALVFPISGRQIYATYPPLYQGAVLGWMRLFGTSVLSAMALHVLMFAISGFLLVVIIGRFFPATARYSLAIWLLFGLTFDDRPESLAYVFGLLALWLVLRQVSEVDFRWGTACGLLASLILCLYTSVIVGAYFFGIGFLACGLASTGRRGLRWFAPFVAAAGLFAAITMTVARLEPLWWAGFMESARQQSVMTTGFRLPAGDEVVKLLRTVPVFCLALAALPWIIGRRKEFRSPFSAWMALGASIFVMGWVLLALSLTLLPANYCNYAIFTQTLLAAGLLAAANELMPQREGRLRAWLWICVLLVSVRAIGMTTWGVVCAWKNSYYNTQTILGRELQPFISADRPVLISSPFLYRAVALGVRNPVHSDWYYDHAGWTNDNPQLQSLARLQPSRLVLTQFDYYRDFVPVLDQLRKRPELVEIRVRNLALVRSPDSIPALQRVVQHISWAPVIVELDWKQPPGS
jgi:hypothetical protein